MTAAGQAADVASATPVSRGLLAALFAVVFAVAGFLPYITEGFDDTIASTNATQYSARIVRTWRHFGFFAMEGEPCLSKLPLDGQNIRRAYRHHPPLFHWCLYATVAASGIHEWSLRLLPAIAAAITAALIAGFVARRLGRLYGIFAAAIFTTTGMFLLYGRMANTESLTLLMIVSAVAANERRARPLTVGIITALATLVDWQGAFLVPAIAFAEWTHPDGTGRMKRVSAAAIGAAAAVALTLLLWSLWARSFHETITNIADMRAHSVNSGALPKSLIAVVLRDAVKLYGLPLLVLGAAALWPMLAAARRGDAAARFGLTLLVPGLLNIAVFRAHAVGHEFWSFYAAGYLAVAPAVLFRGAIGAQPGRGRIVIGVIFALMLVLGDLRIASAARATRRLTDYRAAARTASLYFQADDLVIYSGRFSHEAFYFPFLYFQDITSAEHLRLIAAYRRQGTLAGKRVFYLINAESAQSHPGLIEEVRPLGTIETFGDLTVLRID